MARVGRRGAKGYSLLAMTSFASTRSHVNRRPQKKVLSILVWKGQLHAELATGLLVKRRGVARCGARVCPFRA